MSEETKKLSNEEMEFLDEEVELSKEELLEEAKRIMEEVNGDLRVVDRPLPVKLREKIDNRILALKVQGEKAEVETEEKVETTTAAREEAAIEENVVEQAAEGERFSAEERELMRLGKIYKKKRKMRKYFVLAAAVVCAMAFGVTSMGGPKKLYEKANWTLAGREQTNIHSEGDDILEASGVEEEEAYQQIEDEFGFYPVKPIYKPDGVEILEIDMGEEIQGSNLIYGKDEEIVFSYFIRPNYRNSSYGTDIEDDVIRQYTVQNGNVAIEIKQYSVEEVNNNRWSGEFVYQDVHYFILAMDIKQEEFEKIIKNLNFY
ncbi:MAG: DUF4367 domain-containing protein [Tyzzerella sp.]|nr:DUF4367 domain-containing protein [Tyzzerella sp.]